MRHYSAFQLDATGHVAGRIDLNCIDDEDAKRQAETLVDTCGLELWEDDRMIAPCFRPAIGIHHNRMRTSIVAAVDKQLAKAGRSHFPRVIFCARRAAI
jgi:hypothetical protein